MKAKKEPNWNGVLTNGLVHTGYKSLIADGGSWVRENSLRQLQPTIKCNVINIEVEK